jgi:hypothetical protein
MAKTFYTERDIEELARQGIRSLAVSDMVVLTELAAEKARNLGINLVREHDTPPSAPIRPYLAAAPAQASSSPSSSGRPNEQSKDELRQRVHAAVVARLGNELDPALLDTIIRRVLDNIGIK